MDQKSCYKCACATDNKCPKCQTPYCSPLCMFMDRQNHSILCHEELGDKIKSVIDVVLREIGPSCDGRYWNISYGFYAKCITRVNWRYNLNPFGCSSDVMHCVLCGTTVSCFDESFNHRVVYNGATLFCCVCGGCYHENRKICPVTLRCQTRCWKLHNRVWYSLLGCLQKLKINVPKDIKKIILAAVRCKHVNV